eukprot:COSAG02_NODE_3766_length_6268_cov_9.545145_4_plen_170_part_00
MNKEAQSDSGDKDEPRETDVSREHFHLGSAVGASYVKDVREVALEMEARAELAAIRQDIRSLAAVVESALNSPSPRENAPLQPPGWKSGHTLPAQTVPSSVEAVASHQKTNVDEVRLPEETPADIERTTQIADTDKMPVGLRRDIARILAAAQYVRETQGIADICLEQG